MALPIGTVVVGADERRYYDVVRAGVQGGADGNGMNGGVAFRPIRRPIDEYDVSGFGDSVCCKLQCVVARR